MDNKIEHNSKTSNFMESIELDGFKEKTGQLMSHLKENDVENAMKCIKDINAINGQSFYSTIGKLTRGLHNAISDLNVSSNNTQSENNKTRADLNYVISVTDNAAKKTLDMTENSMTNVHELKEIHASQHSMIQEYMATHTPDDETVELINKLVNSNEKSQQNTEQVSKNITEIIMAQNFQDIASQTITKAIGIINNVEGSLISLTQYATLLSKIGQYSESDIGTFNFDETEDLKSDIDKMNNTKESEHLDQSDVDSLLSSLGF